MADDRVERAVDEAIDDEVVEPARHEREPRPRRDDEAAFDHDRALLHAFDHFAHA